ncbi:hypothetical protein SDC9_195532 [bioreactor metagenome]|uniref:Uncharacterized protein n=1 Tax=bioreactor metagenome TaxID=1076179 RepID=A0A645I9K3_9ZZZZ
MKVALGVERHQIDRREDVERRVPLPEETAVASNRLVRECAGVLVDLPAAGLGDRAEDQHVATQPGGNGHGAIDHARQRPGALVATAIPVHLEPERADQRIGTDR